MNDKKKQALPSDVAASSVKGGTPVTKAEAGDHLVEKIARELSAAILSGALKPGERLAESAIARRMSLSRAPVREALRLLERSRLVDYRANRGFIVHQMDLAEIAALYDLRIVLETAAIRRLVAREDPDLADQLRHQLDLLYGLSGTGVARSRSVDADLEFHRLICRLSGNPRLAEVFEQIANEVKLCINQTGRVEDGPRRIAASHEHILTRVIAADPEGAAAALTDHLREAEAMMRQLFARAAE
ncbi:GntR family transcriptional regulator [Thioclava sp. GXIMD4215]|uniref:GntR family transcriptional regulator n=1 Tax=Thioclava sp. GXIMD4215 TaxID=3131928 RepID=UPI0032470260